MDFGTVYREAIVRDCQQVRQLPYLLRQYAPENPTGEDIQAVLRLADANVAASREFWESVESVAGHFDMDAGDLSVCCPFCEKPYCSNAHVYRVIPVSAGAAEEA